jgi:hypothetical protein
MIFENWPRIGRRDFSGGDKGEENKKCGRGKEGGKTRGNSVFSFFLFFFLLFPFSFFLSFGGFFCVLFVECWF